MEYLSLHVLNKPVHDLWLPCIFDIFKYEFYVALNRVLLFTYHLQCKGRDSCHLGEAFFR